jgi:hypothetical protein
MSLIITLMFEPAKLQMNWASASGARKLRREIAARFAAGSSDIAPGRVVPIGRVCALPRRPHAVLEAVGNMAAYEQAPIGFGSLFRHNIRRRPRRDGGFG